MFCVQFFIRFFSWLGQKRISEVEAGNGNIDGVEVEVRVEVAVQAPNEDGIAVMRDMNETERQKKEKWKESVYVKLR